MNPARVARVQAERGKPCGFVSWEEHLEAYAAYARQYGNLQSAERISERSGFGYWEMTELLGREPTTWQAANLPDRATP
jgi:hypothetical protein